MLLLTMMTSFELYAQILRVEEPWKVTKVEIIPEDEKVFVHLGYDSMTAKFCCPECSATAVLYNHRDERQWRHMDTCQFETYLIA